MAPTPPDWGWAAPAERRVAGRRSRLPLGVLARRSSSRQHAPALFLGDSARRLRLLRGDLAGGLEEMLEAGRLFEEVGSRNPAFIAWRSPAALALLQLGRRDEAGPLGLKEETVR